MNKHIKLIIPVLIIIIVILGSIILFSDVDKEYLFTGKYVNEENNVDVYIIIMQNNNGNLLTYSTNIHYTNDNIVAANLYYLQNDEKHIVLGNSLNMYDYSRKNANKKEYGYDYIDNLLENQDNLYFDLCRDSECNDIVTSIKLNYSTLNWNHIKKLLEMIIFFIFNILYLDILTS